MFLLNGQVVNIIVNIELSSLQVQLNHLVILINTCITNSVKSDEMNIVLNHLLKI